MLFHDVDMKVLMFIELVSGVEYPKITTMGFALRRPIVDVSSVCRSSLLFLSSSFHSSVILVDQTLFYVS